MLQIEDVIVADSTTNEAKRMTHRVIGIFVSTTAYLLRLDRAAIEQEPSLTGGSLCRPGGCVFYAPSESLGNELNTTANRASPNIKQDGNYRGATWSASAMLTMAL